MYMFVIYSYVTHYTYGMLEPTIDLLPTYQGFIAQLVEQRTSVVEDASSIRVVALNLILRLKRYDLSAHVLRKSCFFFLF